MAVISESISFASQHIGGIFLLLAAPYLTSNYLLRGYSLYRAHFSQFLQPVEIHRRRKWHAEATLYKLHQKHGDYVRLGPKVVSIRDLDALEMIYGINKGYCKICCLI